VVEDVIIVFPLADAKGEEKLIWLTRYIIFSREAKIGKRP